MSPVSHPVAAVGAIVFHNDAILLIKRQNPPYANEWAIPGGKVHAGETLQQAAEREVLEETGIHIKAGNPVFTFDLIERDNNDSLLFHYIIVDLDAIYLEGTAKASDDALEAKWITSHELTGLDINPMTKKLLFEKYNLQF